MTNMKLRQVSQVDGAHAQHLESQRPLSISVVSGAAYITREGDYQDYILKSGEVLDIEDKGLVVIQGLPFAEYRVCA